MGEEDLEMTLNGEPYAFYPVQSKPVLLSVTKNQKGQPQTLQLIVKSDGFEFSKLNLYSLNTSLLNERLEQTKAQELKLETFSATHFQEQWMSSKILPFLQQFHIQRDGKYG